MMSVRIAGREVGSGHEPYVVAEMSGNHNGSFERAVQILRQSAEAGVHAVKLQTYTADTMTIDVHSDRFRLSASHKLWGSRTLFDLYQEAHTPWDWHADLFELGRDLGVDVFSSPFDSTAVDLLEDLGAPAYKIASSEIVDLPLIRLVASTGKPVIISTGMATLGEVDAAVSTARAEGQGGVVVLSATTSYPAPVEASNLRAIPVLEQAMGTPVGLSDHTPGIGAAAAAVALGACMVEKHVTLDRHQGGVDAAFSLEPAELAALVVETRRAWQALGSPTLGPDSVEEEGLRFRRSLYVVQDTPAGAEVTTQNVRAIRPAGGLEPDALTLVLGRRFTCDVTRGTPLTWEVI